MSELVLRATGAVGLSEFGMIDGEQLPSILDSVLQSKSSLLLQLSDAALQHDNKVKALEQELQASEDNFADIQAAHESVCVCVCVCSYLLRVLCTVACP